MKLQEIVDLMDARHHAQWFPSRGDAKAGYKKLEGKLTSEQIEKHLDGTAAWGVYCNVDEKQTQSRALVFDFDDHDGNGNAKFPTITVSATLTRLGIPHMIFRSGGGRGFHIWMFFENAHSWQTLQKFAKEVFDSIDEPKTKFVAAPSSRLGNVKLNTKGKQTHVEHAIEVFPKGSGFQNIALPCGRESVPMRIVQDGSITDLEPCSLDDLTIEFVAMATQEVAADEIGNPDDAFDCFIKAYNVDDYQAWGAAGLALVAAFGKDSDWAKDKWITWGATSSKHNNADDGDDHWNGLKPKKYSPMSFWRIATRHGYKGPWPGKRGVSEADIAAFNEEWALMNVHGKVEFINLKSKEPSNKDSFLLLTEPVAKLRDKWIEHPQRRVFHNYVLENPETYDGNGFNMFQAPSVIATDGDAKLYEKYVREIAAQGDDALAHWLMTFAADIVQRPWSSPSGTAIAFRGPQGSGKSFYGAVLEACLGVDHVYEMKDSARIMENHNMDLFGKSVLLAEESIFAKSQKMADFLKGTITGRTKSFNPKYRATFTVKNILRIIASTNHAQAVKIDFDDRRWTVVNVQNHCPFPTDTQAAREWWDPYYDLIRNRPGDVLGYLKGYAVDRDLIGVPHRTAAKARDKVASDPLLQLLDEIARQGYCPHDFAGRGCISATTLHEEAKARGSREAPRTLTNEMRDRYGATSQSKCQYLMREHILGDGSGGYQIIERRHTRSGVQLEPLDVFRKRLAPITGETYPDGGQWRPCDVSEDVRGEATDHNGGADVTEDELRQMVRGEGNAMIDVRDDDVPF